MKTLFVIFLAFSAYSQEHKLEQVETYIYPNPSALGKFNVVAEPNAIFKLYSTAGTYIGMWEFGPSKEICIENIPQGFYQAVIEKDGKFTYKKIVIL